MPELDDSHTLLPCERSFTTLMLLGQNMQRLHSLILTTQPRLRSACLSYQNDADDLETLDHEGSFPTFNIVFISGFYNYLMVCFNYL